MIVASRHITTDELLTESEDLIRRIYEQLEVIEKVFRIKVLTEEDHEIKQQYSLNRKSHETIN